MPIALIKTNAARKKKILVPCRFSLALLAALTLSAYLGTSLLQRILLASTDIITHLHKGTASGRLFSRDLPRYSRRCRDGRSRRLDRNFRTVLPHLLRHLLSFQRRWELRFKWRRGLGVLVQWARAGSPYPGFDHGDAPLSRVDDGRQEGDLVANRQHERLVAEAEKNVVVCSRKKQTPKSVSWVWRRGATAADFVSHFAVTILHGLKQSLVC